MTSLMRKGQSIDLFIRILKHQKEGKDYLLECQNTVKYCNWRGKYQKWVGNCRPSLCVKRGSGVRGRMYSSLEEKTESEPLIKELGWLTIKQLIDTETVKIVYKALHNEAPVYVKELFHRLSGTQNR